VSKSVAVLGAIVYDEIVTHDSRRIESFGGIVYNLAALSSLVGDDARILPFSNVGADRWDDVCSLVGDMSGVDMNALRQWDGKLTHARLVYTDANHRDEYVMNMMRPFTDDELEAATKADGVIINFVNGTEIDLPTLKAFRAKSNGVFYLDMHNIMVRFGDKGDKNVIDFSDWRDWVAQFDLVQMNEFEAETVLGRKLVELEDYLGAAQEVLQAGPEAALVTMGPRGVALAHRRDGVCYAAHIPAAPVHNFIDATGCGDAFSTGTLWNYLETGDILTAAIAGALVGAINTEVQGIGSIDKARGAADRIEEVDAELAAKVRNGWPGERI
jgi:sugar/nucleoside kinase (ribokinase family)